MIRVIAFCGIDGSGKTTQVRRLANHLAHRDVKFRRVWLRWPAFFSYPFLALCRLLGYTEWKTIQGSSIRYAERRFYRNKAIAKLWPWLFTVDTLIHSVLRILIPLKLGYWILCDRYMPDILVDLMCDTKDNNLLERMPRKLLLASIPNRSVTLLIDVNEPTAYMRKSDIPSIESLKERRKLYLKLAHALNIPVLDGEKKPEEIHQEIIERISSANV